MLQEKLKVQVVIPIYNEEDCVAELIRRLERTSDKLSPAYEMEIIFVNDGSKDRTLELLLEISRQYQNIVIINLARNFGHQIALSAGLDLADADYVLIIDGDLQDPPESLILMLQLAKQGADVVYGQRTERNGETYFKRLTAYFFYRLIVKLCRVDIPKDTGDFRLINRKVLYAFKKLRERHRFVRGLVPWLGFKSVPFEYKRDTRYAGTTKYPFRKMFRFALDAIFSFSNIPLKVGSYTGIFMVFLSSMMAIYVLYLKLIKNSPAPGLTSILSAIFLLGGIQILLLGIIGEYIGRIFDEVKARPLYVIDHIYKNTP